MSIPSYGGPRQVRTPLGAEVCFHRAVVYHSSPIPGWRGPGMLLSPAPKVPMRTSCDQMVSTWWQPPASAPCNASRCPETLYLGHWKHNSVNHLGHSNSCNRVFFYCPLGALKMDLSPNFTWFIKFLPVWVGPCEDEQSPSFSIIRSSQVKEEGQLGSLPPLSWARSEPFA